MLTGVAGIVPSHEVESATEAWKLDEEPQRTQTHCLHTTGSSALLVVVLSRVGLIGILPALFLIVASLIRVVRCQAPWLLHSGRVQARYGAQQSNVACNPLLAGERKVVTEHAHSASV